MNSIQPRLISLSFVEYIRNCSDGIHRGEEQCFYDLQEGEGWISFRDASRRRQVDGSLVVSDDETVDPETGEIAESRWQVTPPQHRLVRRYAGDFVIGAKIRKIEKSPRFASDDDEWPDHGSLRGLRETICVVTAKGLRDEEVLLKERSLRRVAPPPPPMSLEEIAEQSAKTAAFLASLEEATLPSPPPSTTQLMDCVLAVIEIGGSEDEGSGFA